MTNRVALEQLIRDISAYLEANLECVCRQVEPFDFEEGIHSPLPLFDEESDIEALLSGAEDGFSKTLLRLIDRSGQKDPEIYKKAHIDRKLFSKIKNDPQYTPSKRTVLAFALALELTLDETQDILSRAGYALSHSSEFDLIIEYCIKKKMYHIITINEVLFRFGQPLLCV